MTADKNPSAIKARHAKGVASSQKKLFFSGVLILTFSNIVIKIIGLLFKIPITNIIGDEGMGYFNLTYVIYVWFYQISTSGLPTAVSLLTSESRAKGNIREVRRIFRISLILFIVIGLVGMLIMMIGSGMFARMMASPEIDWCIIAIAPTLFFICISSSIRGYFQGYQNMFPTAVSQLIEALGKMILGILFAAYGIKAGFPLPTVAALAISGLTIGAFGGMVFLVISRLDFKDTVYDAEYLTPRSSSMPMQSPKQLLTSLAVIAIPITLAASMPSLTSLLDAAIIVRCLESAGFIHTEAVEIYGNYTSEAIPMFNLPPVLIYPISYSLIPLLTASISSRDKEGSEQMARAAIRAVFIIIAPCALGMAAMSEPILKMFYRASSAEQAAPLLTLLAPAAMFVGLLSITNAILQSYGFERKPIISMVLGSVVKLILSAVLVSQHSIGIKGAPIGTFICYLTIAACNFYFLKKHVGMSMKILVSLIKPLIAAAVCAVSAVLIHRVLYALHPGRIAALAAIFCAAVVYFVAILLMKTITKEELELMPKGKKIYALLKKANLVV